MKFTVTATLSAALLASSVSAHGFLSGIGKLSSSERGQVRDYNKINVQIDDLRNPLEGNTQLCRGAAKGPVVPLTLTEGGELTLTQAFSLGAQHIGPCAVEIVDAKNPNNKVTLVSVTGANGCARPPIAQFDTDKASAATNQCHGKIPAGLVTNDMCLHYWTFKTQNVNKITCTDCILRWTWAGEHISKTNPELYENCIDVRVTKGAGGSTNTPPVDIPDPDTNTNTNIPPVVVTPPKPNTPAPTPAPAPAPAPAPPATPATPASPSSCADNFMVCDGKNFLVCFPGQAGRAPTPMSCAQGTKCKQFGKYIQCA